jgi:hypothetical protein
VLYGNATSAIGVTSTGVTGQILTSNAPSAPSFKSYSKLVEIQSQSVSGSPTVIDFTTGIVSAYNTYLLLFSNLVPSSADTFQLLVSTDGGSTFKTTGYTSTVFYMTYNANTRAGSNQTTYMQLSQSVASPSSGFNCALWCHNLTDGTNNVSFHGDGFSDGGTAGTTYRVILATAATWTSVNALRITTVGATALSSGKVTLYGLSETA